MYFTVPGLRNSAPGHWQSIWEKNHPADFSRISQLNWQEPECAAWIQKIEQDLRQEDLKQAILIGHSVGCAALIHWHKKFRHTVKGMLLVAPSDVERPDYPSYIKGFSPLPLEKLPFKTVVVASTNDHVVDLDRARYFAQCWGSELVTLENAGHIEGKSGYGEWIEGFELLKGLR